MISKVKTWANKPLNTRLMPLMFYVILAAVWTMVLVGGKTLDCDTLYMIPQGRKILESGFSRVNDITFFEGHAIIVQQWIYCVALALLDEAFGLWGLIIFGLVQALALFALVERYLRKYNGDRFWTYLAAAIVSMSDMGYFISVRPENLTLILLMLDLYIIDKYRKTEKPGWLYLLPVITLVEINAHASMWVFHFCVLLACAFPNVSKNSLINTQIRPTKHLIPVTALMIGSLFINPYGVDNVTYVFKSLNTFNVIDIAEQRNVTFVSASGIVLTTVLLIAAVMLAKKTLSSSAAYMTAGFGFMAMSTYHGNMFMTIAIALLAADLLSKLSKLTEGRTLASNLTNTIWLVIPITLTCTAVTGTWALTPEMTYKFMHYDGSLKEAVEYIKDNTPDGEENGNVLNIMDIGSYFEYYGLVNLYADTRPEFLNKKINGKQDTMTVHSIMTYGEPGRRDEPLDPADFGIEDENIDINTISGVLEAFDIEYIVTYSIPGAWPALHQYLLDHPDEYGRVEINSNKPGKKPMICLYERKD